MTEVPEHLLARSKQRREALGLSEGGDAPPVDAPAPSAAVEKAAGATPGAAPATAPSGPVPAKAPAAAPPAPPPPLRPEVAAYENRKKIPWWAASVLAGLPIWAGVYAWTLEPPTHEAEWVSEAREVYDVAGGCGACHGADGGGGVGPAFQAGAIIETWPEYTDHIEWVALGSAGWPEDTYGAQNKPVDRASGMPAFEERLTEEELALVVRYEREVLGGAECEPELAELTGEPCE